MRLTLADLDLLPMHEVLALLRARLEMPPDAACPNIGCRPQWVLCCEVSAGWLCAIV